MESQKSLNKMSSGLILLSGIPACGKSTLTRMLLKNYEKISAFSISFDEIEKFLLKNPCFKFDERVFEDDILKIISSKDVFTRINAQDLLMRYSEDTKKELSDNSEIFSAETWKQSRIICLQLCKIFLDCLGNSNREYVIILDDNFILKSMRKPFYILAHKYKIGYCEIRINADIKTCIERNSMRSKSEMVPEEKLKDSAAKIEDSAHQEHFISFENNHPEKFDLDLKEIMKSVQEKLSMEVKYTDEKELQELRAKEAELTRSNLIHQLDLKIRALINALSKATKEELSKIFSQNDIPEPLIVKKALAFLSEYKNYFLECVSSVLNEVKVNENEFWNHITKQKFSKNIKKEFEARKINFEENHQSMMKILSSKEISNDIKSVDSYTNAYISQIYIILMKA